MSELSKFAGYQVSKYKSHVFLYITANNLKILFNTVLFIERVKKHTILRNTLNKRHFKASILTTRKQINVETYHIHGLEK